MTSAELLRDAFSRVSEIVHRSMTGIDATTLAFQPEPGANSIAWLVWHLTRVQDDHVAEVASLPERWEAAGWYERSGLPFGASSTGFGHSPEEVRALGSLDPALLLAYHDDVATQTHAFVAGLVDVDLDRIVDTSWDPPVTLGVRLISVIADNLQHAGQAAYLRGIAARMS